MGINGKRGTDGVKDYHHHHKYDMRYFRDETQSYEYKDKKHEFYGGVDLSKMFLDPDFDQYLNWVFDLETLGTKRNSIVTEVSAVGFDFRSGKQVAERTWHLDIDSQVAQRQISGDTIAFWMMQSDEAREKVCRSSRKYCNDNGLELPLPIGGFLLQLSNFMRDVSKKWGKEHNLNTEPLVWGNGISFDLGKIENLYETNNMELPWQYWAERDARTFCSCAPNIKAEFWNDFQGIKHFGLDDCKHEMRYIMAIFHEIKLASQAVKSKLGLLNG